MVGYCKKYAWYMSKREVERMGCVDRDKQCLYNRKRCRHFVTDNFFVSVGDVARFSGKDGERMYNAQLQKEMKDLLSAWQEWEIGFIFGNTKWKKGKTRGTNISPMLATTAQWKTAWKGYYNTG